MFSKSQIPLAFHAISTDENCPICWETMTGTAAVAHKGVEGEKHPWHLECIKKWLKETKYQAVCPSCQEPLNVSYLFTLNERIVSELTCLKEDVYTGILNTIFHLGIASVFLAPQLVIDKFCPLLLSDSLLISAITILAMYQFSLFKNRTLWKTAGILTAIYFGTKPSFLPFAIAGINVVTTFLIRRLIT